MGYLVKNQGSGRRPIGTVVPSGTTANQSAIAESVEGTLRFNTSTTHLEFFDGTIYQELVSAGLVPIIVDPFVGDGIITVFTMSQAATVPEQLLVFVGGVYQAPTTYSVLNTDISFSEAPPDNAPISVIHNLGTIT